MAKNKIITKGLVFYLVLVLLAVILVVYGYSKIPPKSVDQPIPSGMYSGNPQSSSSSTPIPSTSQKPTTSTPPVSGSGKTISVAFTTQAPYGVWDKVHNEACEEASVIMAVSWVNGKTSLSQEYAEQEIQKLTQWGLDHYNNSYDTSADQTAKMAEAVYGVKSRLIKNPTIENIRSEIDQNHVVVMGMTGMTLENPYFKSPGPIYHMLVIKGYDKTGFVVNDSGTRHGESFHYSYDNLMQSAHDWPGSADGLYQAPSVAIIFSK